MLCSSIEASRSLKLGIVGAGSEVIQSKVGGSIQKVSSVLWFFHRFSNSWQCLWNHIKSYSSVCCLITKCCHRKGNPSNQQILPIEIAFKSCHRSSRMPNLRYQPYLTPREPPKAIKILSIISQPLQKRTNSRLLRSY